MRSPLPAPTTLGTFTLEWDGLLFVYHLPRRVPSLKARQPCSLLLDFCSWFHLPSPFQGSTALLVVLPRPRSLNPPVSFLVGTLEHWYVITQKPTALTAHGCHQKRDVSSSPGTVLAPQWAQQAHCQVCAGGGGTPDAHSGGHSDL